MNPAMTTLVWQEGVWLHHPNHCYPTPVRKHQPDLWVLWLRFLQPSTQSHPSEYLAIHVLLSHANYP